MIGKVIDTCASTNMKSIMVDGIPMFLATDVRKLIGADKLEVTPVVVVSEGVTKVHQMISLIAIVDAVLQKSLDESEDEFIGFMKHLFESMEGDDHESNPD